VYIASIPKTAHGPTTPRCLDWQHEPNRTGPDANPSPTAPENPGAACRTRLPAWLAAPRRSWFDVGRFADFEWGISAVTLGELRLGVLQAKDPETASARLSAYQFAQRSEALAVDEAVSEAWALPVSRLRAAGRKVPVNDS
jgi:hypothetical protein